MIDLDRLLALRLIVARHGEMDRAGWWNTDGMLGRYGATVLQRGLPKTHLFAQARVVFAVADARCKELFDAPDSVTLWSLTPEVEDAFDEHWQTWMAERSDWEPLFERLASDAPEPTGLVDELVASDLLSTEQVDSLGALRRSAEGRAVRLDDASELTDDVITLLAAGFAKGEPRAPAIPYARVAA